MPKKMVSKTETKEEHVDVAHDANGDEVEVGDTVHVALKVTGITVQTDRTGKESGQLLEVAWVDPKDGYEEHFGALPAERTSKKAKSK